MQSVFPAIWEADHVLGYAGVLAHQGGWDEALMVIVPVGLFVGLLWASIRRSAAAEEHPDPDGPAPDRRSGSPKPPRTHP